jgi:hypothetical protein
MLALLALAGGCDTTQPQQFDEQTFEFRALGVNSQMTSYNTWQMYEDLDKDGQQDPEEQSYLFCEDLGFEVEGPSSAPFRFTIVASLLSAGSSDWVQLTSNDSTNANSNLALYDQNQPSTTAPVKAPITVGSRTFRFSDVPEERRQLSAANREVVRAVFNPLSALDPDTYGLGNGLCSSYDPGESVIDNQEQPLEVVLRKGDTIKVELRRGSNTPEGIVFGVEPEIKTVLLLDGREVSVNGTDLTTKEPGAPLSFTYTFR